MDDEVNGTRIIFYLSLVASFLLIVSAVVYWYFEDAGLSVLSLTVSGILSASLVILYFRQTRLLKSQKELLTQELNREARQQHTEALRKRVRSWHGNPDREIASNPLKQKGLNIPKVRGATFSSSPTGVYSDDSFQVVPDHLQNDRYLEDLLENHAPDLRKAKNEVEKVYSEFTSLREEFKRGFEDDILYESDEIRIELDDLLSQWIFEFLIRHERGMIEDIESVYQEALSDIETGMTVPQTGSSEIEVTVNRGGGSRMAIYHVHFKNGGEIPNELPEEAEYQIKELTKGRIDDANTGELYNIVMDSARLLEESEEKIEKLEQTLIEYEGRPIYRGDCKYLEEAKI